MRVLVVYKETTLERYRAADDPALQALIDAGDVSVALLQRSHDRHHRSLQEVLEVLARSGVEYDAAPRDSIEDVQPYELVVPVGGDGNVLFVSRHLSDQKMLAINSDPGTSFGYFCAGGSAQFAGLLDKTLTDAWEPSRLMRFGVMLNGEPRGAPILNDILVCHANPAAVSSYILRVGEAQDEAQKSSGIWISTAAGSTAAIRSAGGYVMPLDSRRIQYLVREPCPPNVGAYRHIKGIRELSSRFEVISKMPEGRVYLDGPHVSIDFGVGDVVTIRGDVPALSIYGIADKIRD